MNQFLSQATGIDSTLRDLADHFHRYPELSFQEVQTTKTIRSVLLDQLGYEEVPLGIKTGLVAILRGDLAGKTVAIRADIDAIAEQEDSAGPVVSTINGKMHACGHDFHISCALGAAMLLREKKARLYGNVVFVFQPGEEETKGAQYLLDHGLFKALPKLSAMFALHTNPSLNAGTIGLVKGAMFAGKRNFRIRLTGVSGHCGMPHECTDVIVAGAALIQGVQTIVSRNADPRAALVCSIVSVQAGNLGFFATDTMQCTGTIRALDEVSLRLAKDRLTELCEYTSRAYRCRYHLEFFTAIPPVLNADQLFEPALHAAKEIAGNGAVLCEPILGSDDFALFAAKVPAFYYWLGTGFSGQKNFNLHHPSYQANKKALAPGAALLAQAAWDTLSSSSR